MSDPAATRKCFPALQSKQIFFDNAGGTQVVQGVTESVVNYLVSNNAQIGASYPVSLASQKLIEDGWTAAAEYINADRHEIMLGASTTQLFRNLATSLADYIDPGDEIIVSKIDHEANIAPWVHLAKDRGAILKWFEPTDKTNPRIDCQILRCLMSSRTKLFACTQTSNILGTINNAREIADTVHQVPGALVCIDGVAYAPHRSVDVKAWGVDFYSFSWYKVFGPHIATLYASTEAQKHLRIIGHPYKPADSLENILGLAAANYELTAAIPDVCEFIQSLSWDHVAAHEEILQAILIDYLNSKGDLIKIWGEPVADKAKRVPVISFTVKGWNSKSVVEEIQARSNFGCKWGSFLSIRLCEDCLGLDIDDGVVRVSLAHYNSEEEVRGFIKVLESIVSPM